MHRTMTIPPKGFAHTAEQDRITAETFRRLAQNAEDVGDLEGAVRWNDLADRAEGQVIRVEEMARV